MLGQCQEDCWELTGHAPLLSGVRSTLFTSRHFHHPAEKDPVFPLLKTQHAAHHLGQEGWTTTVTPAEPCPSPSETDAYKLPSLCIWVTCKTIRRLSCSVAGAGCSVISLACNNQKKKKNHASLEWWVLLLRPLPLKPQGLFSFHS